MLSIYLIYFSKKKICKKLNQTLCVYLKIYSVKHFEMSCGPNTESGSLFFQDPDLFRRLGSRILRGIYFAKYYGGGWGE